MDLQFDFPLSFPTSKKAVVATPAMIVDPSSLKIRQLSILSYELKFAPGNYFSFLKPDPKHKVYDP